MSTMKNQESVPDNELSHLRKQVTNKDIRYATLENELLKKNNELLAAKGALDDALYKLRNEADRALKFETSLSRCSEDLRAERLTRQNLESSFKSANEKVKSEELTSKHLQLELENYASRTAVQHETELIRLRDEKTMLENRVRALDSQLQANRPSQLPTRLPRPTTFSGPTSDANDARIATLESELSRAERELADASRMLLAAQQEATKVPRLQSDLIAAQNAQMRAERAAKSEKENADSVQEALREREEELEYLRGLAGEQSMIDSRMEEAVRERDEAVQKEEEVRRHEKAMRQRVEEMEEREAELVMEREEALNVLHQLQAESHSGLTTEDASTLVELRAAVAERDAALLNARGYTNELQQMYRDTLAACDDAEARTRDLELQLQRPNAPPLIIVSPPPSPSPAPPFLIHPPSNGAAEPGCMSLTDEAIVARLLTAIERLRGERDTLRRDLHFARVEHQVTGDVLRTKLEAAESELCKTVVASQTHLDEASRAAGENVTEARRLNDELERCHRISESLNAQLADRLTELEARDRELENVRARVKDLEETKKKTNASRERETRLAVASLVVVQNLWSQLEEAGASTKQLILVRDELVQARNELVQAHDQLVSTRDQASTRLSEVIQTRDVSLAAQETLRRDLSTSDARLADALKAVAERDVQITDTHARLSELQSVVSTLQRKLADAHDAEIRRSEQQLAKLPSGPAEALKSQLEQLEQRVLRRTEQIGMQQHDIKRLETNLRVAEDTIGELTAELETLGREKACLVEDCAQAREARDEAHRKVEDLEVELETIGREHDDLETVEGMLRDSQAEVAASEERVEAMVWVVANSATRSRGLSTKLALTTTRLSAVEADLHAAEASHSHTQAKVERLTSEFESKASLLCKSTASIEALTQALAISEDETHCLSVAFESFKNDIQSREQEASGQTHHLNATIEELEGHLAAAQVSEAALSQELETARQDEIRLRAQVQEVQTESRAVAAEAERLSANIAMLEHALETEQSSHSEALAQAHQIFERRTMEVEAQVEESRRQHGLLEETLAKVVQESAAKSEELQARLAEARTGVATQDSLEADLRRLRVEHADEVLVLRSRFDESLGQIDSLQAQLQAATEIITDYESDIEACTQRYESAQVEIRALEHALTSTRAQLDEHDASIQALHREKIVLQGEHTQLEAELERSITKYQYLEQQAKRSDHELARLKAEVERCRAEAAKFDEAAQTAETSLIFKTVQFEQKLAMMQRELKKQQEHRHCQESIAEFKEKNEYLEEMLRMKSVEIEENDDRFIDALKEKKRLNGKVENLTRKVQNLQTKLATAMSASATPSPTTPAGVPAARPKTPSPLLPQMPSAGPSIHPPTRIPSSPATALRARTPELSRRAFVSRLATPEPPVPPLPRMFAVKTPEPAPVSRTVESNRHLPSASHAMVPAAPSTPLSSRSRKRRAPDDFDSPAPLPAQAIVAPSASLTPRHARRPTNDSRGKFTPTRNGTAAPKPVTFSQPSPLRRMTAPLAESTNSPRGNRVVSLEKPAISKPPMRSWLNKTRAPTPGGIEARSMSVLGLRP